MKAKFFRLISPISIEEHVEQLFHHQYSDKVARGFIVDEVSKLAVRGRHIVKREIVEVAEGPFGEKFERSIVLFDKVTFCISKRFPGLLEITNPPRRTSSFFNDIRRTGGLGTIVEELSINIPSIIKKLEESGISCQVLSSRISDINVLNMATGALDLQGSKDIRQATKSFLSDRSYRWRQAKFVFSVNDLEGSVVLSDKGAIKVEGNIDYVLDALREKFFD